MNTKPMTFRLAEAKIAAYNADGTFGPFVDLRDAQPPLDPVPTEITAEYTVVQDVDEQHDDEQKEPEMSLHTLLAALVNPKTFRPQLIQGSGKHRRAGITTHKGQPRNKSRVRMARASRRRNRQ